jgi:hypothetical protein
VLINNALELNKSEENPCLGRPDSGKITSGKNGPGSCEADAPGTGIFL